ncbi:MAG: hypothetical protein QNJ98_03385 [Planctomycetota bacterium]|nr:hypothetical protein [Planctomycetota bacterium]
MAKEQQATTPDIGGISEVREILFGARFREVLTKIGDVERILKEELGSLREQLQGELKQVATDGQAQDDALDARVDAALERIDAVDKDSGKALDDARAALEKQVREMTARLTHEADTLRSEKVSREQLGQMLVEMGRQLANEPAKAPAE